MSSYSPAGHRYCAKLEASCSAGARAPVGRSFPDSSRTTARMADPLRQSQFLDVIDRDEAERRFQAVLDLRPLPAETVPLSEAAGRVLGADVIAPADVPGFDRS